MKRLIALLLAAVLAVPAVAFAQTKTSAEQEQQTKAAAGQQQPSVDATKLGVSLSRIKRELAEEGEAEDSSDRLHLRFTIAVVGTAPKIDFLEGFNVNGPVSYGPPTHQEVLNVLTPKEFRTPVIPFYSLAAMAAQKLWDYNKKKGCEAELAEYRRLVMQGVAVAAPRCSQ